MKQHRILSTILALGFMGGMAAAAEHGGEHQANKSDLQVVAKAKLTQQQAAKTALARVPQGKIKEAELEMEDGVLIWSFDIAMPRTPILAEVAVNAVTGEVVNMELEKPEGGPEKGEVREHGEKKSRKAEAREKREKREKKAKGQEEDDDEHEEEHEG